MSKHRKCKRKLSRRNTKIFNNKYDQINASPVKFSKVEVEIHQECTSKSHLFKKLRSAETMPAENKKHEILKKSISKEILELSEENKSESSVASEHFSINMVPCFLKCAAAKDSELRKFIQISGRFRSRRNKLRTHKVSDADEYNLELKNCAKNCRNSSNNEVIKDSYNSINSKIEESKQYSKEESEQDKISHVSIHNKGKRLSSKPSKRSDSTPLSNNLVIENANKDESSEERSLKMFRNNSTSKSKGFKSKFRKIVSNNENMKSIQKLDLSMQFKYPRRSRSKNDLRRKIKFAETIDIDKVEIHQMFTKSCGCPSMLVVDDQYINRFIILKYAEKYGILCDEAEDGQEALEKCKKAGEKKCCQGYSLVLMDLNMPNMGGIEATKEIIKCKIRHLVSPFIEIIAVTAFVSEKEKEKCLSVGMSEFIPKPFTICDFVRLVAN